MFKPIPVAIGLRYLRAKRRNGFISFISLASILGIALGVAALITTLAVMSGFQREIRDRMLQMVAHATVSGYGEPVRDWPQAVKLAAADKRVAGAAPYVEKETLLTGARNQPAMVRGVVPAEEPKVSVIADRMVQGKFGSLQPGSFNIILGKELALWLGVGVGDKVTMMTSDFRSTPMGALPQLKRFTVSGIFEAGYNEYDKGMAFVHMQDLQRVLRMGDGVTGVRLKLHDMDQAWNVARDLALNLGEVYRVSDWTSENANMFRALKMEKVVMFILLSLVIAIAAFNLVSSLVMLVQDKQSDIAILRTLGMSPGAVMRVFIVQGMVIGVLGIGIGVGRGVLLGSKQSNKVRFIEEATQTELMPSDVYYISGVPTLVDPKDVLMIAIVAFVLCLLATLYPAWRASRTDPATALRYE